MNGGGVRRIPSKDVPGHGVYSIVQSTYSLTKKLGDKNVAEHRRMCQFQSCF